jgi:hypothetical protein
MLCLTNEISHQRRILDNIVRYPQIFVIYGPFVLQIWTPGSKMSDLTVTEIFMFFRYVCFYSDMGGTKVVQDVESLT